MFRSRFALLACAAASLLLSACASSDIRLYDGPQKPANEIARISMPEQLEVASINGKNVPGAEGLVSKGDKHLEVAPGRYQLLVFYREGWNLQAEGDILKSDPALFTIDAQAGHQYRIDYQHPNDYAGAKALAADFKGWVTDQTTGGRTASQDSGLKFNRGLMAQMAGRDELVPVAAAAADGSGAQVVEPLAPAGAVAAATTSPTAAVTGNADKTAQWLDLMKGWWQQASTDERREFLKWIGEKK